MTNLRKCGKEWPWSLLYATPIVPRTRAAEQFAVSGHPSQKTHRYSLRVQRPQLRVQRAGS